MAYIGQEEKKQLAPAIKKVLAKYNTKGTIAIKHHSTLVVNISASEIDLCEVYYQMKLNDRYHTQRENIEKVDHFDLNRYYFADKAKKLGFKKAGNFIDELVTAMKGSRWFDDSNAMTDYFHTAYYLDINVGKYNKPFKHIKKASKTNSDVNIDIKPGITLNEKLNGIELKFNSKPSEEIRTKLKELQFRWHSKKAIWYAKQSPERIELANQLFN